MESIASIRNLSYAYRGYEEIEVLHQINLEVYRGEFLIIAGRTGSGKSTLLYTLNGLVPHSFGGRLEGEVEVCGMQTRDVTIAQLARKVGMVLQSAESQLVGLTVEEDVEFGLENIGLPRSEIKERAAYALHQVRLQEHLERSPWTLSGGQKQRLAIASALAFQPEILALDNPTAELDPIGKEDVINTIAHLNREFGITIIMINQELHEVMPFATRIGLLDNGRLALVGPPAEVLNEAEQVRQIGVKLPDVTEVAYQLRKLGRWQGNLPVTVQEANQQMQSLFVPGHAVTSAGPNGSAGQKVIEVQGLHFNYPGGKPVLKGIDLSIQQGQFVCLMGPNGTGKTTLAKHFNGLLKPTQGSVVVYGKDTRQHSVTELAAHVGYVFQNPDHQIFSQTVKEELAFGPGNLHWPKDRIETAVQHILADLGMENQAESEPYLMGLAERKLIAIGSILIMGPELLVLDEPATGADFGVAQRIMRYISQLHSRGLTVVIITHDVSLAANYADRLLVMRDGQIVLDGPPHEVLQDAETLRSCFVAPPQVVEIAKTLPEQPHVIRVDELVDLLKGSEG